MLVDFHNHILPDVDDGSKSLKMSIDMLEEASKQGITDIVNTTHFQHPKMYNKSTDYDYLLEILLNLEQNLTVLFDLPTLLTTCS